MKKILSFLLLICLTISIFVGCTEKAEDPIDNPDDPVVDPIDKPDEPDKPDNPDNPDEPDEPNEPTPDLDTNYNVDGSLFLSANPIVTVRDGEYEIIIDALNEGYNYIVLDNQVYYAKDKIDDGYNFYRIRIPQETLNAVKTYAVCYKGPEDEIAHGVEFTFKPIEKNEGINVIVLSDIHAEYKTAKKEMAYFGDDLDLIVFNGDIDQSIESTASVVKILRFFAESAQGKIPVVFSRGNTEYYGANEECYLDYLSENGKSYYKFSIGAIEGLVLDSDPLGKHCTANNNADGKDNMDVINEEIEFLKNTTLANDKINFIVSFIDPNTINGWNGAFETYCNCINELKIDFMISGREHLNLITAPDAASSLQVHNYTIINGCKASETEKHSFIALTLYKDKVDVSFVDAKLSVMDTATVTYPAN